MKNHVVRKSTFVLALVLSALCLSCGQNNDNSSQQKEIEGNPETTISTTNDRVDGYDGPLDNHNAVKVPINVNENLNWTAFKQRFHQPSESPEEFPFEAAVGPWITTEEFEYQRVYRMENNNLWIQTYYKKIGTSNEIDTNVFPSVLTLQNAETTGLGTLWNDMIERGLFLTDSLSN